MGMITKVLEWLFGGGQDAISRSIEIFRVNAEAEARRDLSLRRAAMQQYAKEFARERRSLFDRFMDALNRLPRPALALGTLGLFISAMTDPVWFAARMEGLALVPEPMWWLLGAVVTFYFGARFQVKGQEFQRGLIKNLALHQQLLPQTGIDDSAKIAVPDTAYLADDNAALHEWHQAKNS